MPRRHQLGISFFPKTRLKHRVRGLQKKLDKVKEKVCDLEKRVTIEKERAAVIFTKAEYDQFIGTLDQRFNDTCDCAQSATGKPSKSSAQDAREEIEKKCKEELFKAGKIKRPGGSGRISEGDKKAIEDCLKAKNVSMGCRIKRR